MVNKGTPTPAICNVVGSAITRKAQGVITTNAGPEIGVASTKASTARLTALFTLALYLGQQRGHVTPEQSRYYVDELMKLPQKIEDILRSLDGDQIQCGSSGLQATELARRKEGASAPVHTTRIADLAQSFSTARDFLFLGRGIHYPIALEGALKLKEISYIHAEGYPAGEMKHGPNALIDETLPVVCIATKDPADPASVLKYEKTLSNIQEVTARSGRVIAIATAPFHYDEQDSATMNSVILSEAKDPSDLSPAQNAQTLPSTKTNPSPLSSRSEAEVPVLSLSKEPASPTHEQLKARAAHEQQEHEHLKSLVEHVITIPAAPELLLPILEVVPLQLLAYHIAVRRGCDVDQPRNLAKSVTVE